MNTQFINYIITNHYVKINGLNFLIFTIGFLHRVFGLNNLHDHLAGVVLNITFCSCLIGVYLYVNTAIYNLSLIQMKAVNKIIIEISISQEVLEEFFDMFQTMSEGILVFQNKIITFSNNAFKKIIQNINFQDDEVEIDIFDYKLFKIYNKDEVNNVKGKNKINKSHKLN